MTQIYAESFEEKDNRIIEENVNYQKCNFMLHFNNKSQNKSLLKYSNVKWFNYLAIQ
jgi:hypothetical protein